eukprot:gene18963-24773_t
MSTTDSSNHFDYLVIGGGSGGMATARRAAGYGAKVGLIEKQALGGTCVNVGCVPKKIMFNAATINHIIAYDAEKYGFEIPQGQGKLVKQNNQVAVTVNDKTYTAKHIVIAVGGKPNLPQIKGIEHGITSDGFFQLENQPKRVAVVGGGYIAVELAGVFEGLGSKTSLIVRSEKPLANFDSGVINQLLTEMKRQDNSLTLVTSKGDKLGPYDSVLFAIGRSPLLQSLGVEDIGLEKNSRGYIKVDEFQQSSLPGVYAIGDVCGNVELTPTAIAAGRRLADRLFGNIPHAKADYTFVPTVVFSHPTIGTVGYSEEAAIEKYGKDNIKSYTSTFVNLYYGPMAIDPSDKPKTFMKLVTLLPTEKVIGVHIVGMSADEILQGFAVAVKMGATKADFDRSVAIHPTAAEELVTIAPWGLAPGF